MDISTDSAVGLDDGIIEDMREPRHPGPNEGDIDDRAEQWHGQDDRLHGGAARGVNAITTVIIANPSLVPPAFNGASGTDSDGWIRKFINYCEFRTFTG